MTKNQKTQPNSEDAEIQTVTNLPALYQAYARKVFHYHYSRVQNLHEAEDLTSLTFMSAWEKWHTLRDPTKATAWLFTIARNKAFDHFRNPRTIQHEELNDEMTPSLSPEDSHFTPDTQERLLDLRGLLDQLSEVEQELIHLRLVSELPFKQIALVLREPETRIKKRYYRLLERLQAQMEQK